MSPEALEISVGEAAKRRSTSAEDFILLDVRELNELALSRIEGARHIPMGDIPASLQHLDPHKDLIVFCHSGRRSLSVANWLRQQGLPRVWSLRGGIDAWSREIDPRVPRY